MSFYEDMEKALLEAIEIENENIPIIEVKGMPAPTYRIKDVISGSMEIKD